MQNINAIGNVKLKYNTKTEWLIKDIIKYKELIILEIL